jgi:hypothetical protein
MANLDDVLGKVFNAPKPKQETMNYQAESGVIGHVVVASVERLNIPDKTVIGHVVKKPPTTLDELPNGFVFGKVYQGRRK